ncbi:exported hypothetical protein [uncultured Gammaproteobacteria bacterium]
MSQSRPYLSWFLRSLLLVVALASLPPAAPAAPADNGPAVPINNGPAVPARAVVRTEQGVFLTDETGKILQTLVGDGDNVCGAALSSDGARVALDHCSSELGIQISAAAGGRPLILASTPLGAANAFDGLGWIGPQVVWAWGHIGPRSGTFAAWRLPANPQSDEAPQVVITAVGGACVPTPTLTDVACLEDALVKPGPGDVAEAEELVPNSRLVIGNRQAVFPPERLPGERDLYPGPVWSADGARVAVVERSARGSVLVVVARDGGSWRDRRFTLPANAGRTMALRWEGATALVLTVAEDATSGTPDHAFRVATDAAEPRAEAVPVPIPASRPVEVLTIRHPDGRREPGEVMDWVTLPRP